MRIHSEWFCGAFLWDILNNRSFEPVQTNIKSEQCLRANERPSYYTYSEQSPPITKYENCAIETCVWKLRPLSFDSAPFSPIWPENFPIYICIMHNITITDLWLRRTTSNVTWIPLSWRGHNGAPTKSILR